MTSQIGKLEYDRQKVCPVTFPDPFYRIFARKSEWGKIKDELQIKVNITRLKPPPETQVEAAVQLRVIGCCFQRQVNSK